MKLGTRDIQRLLAAAGYYRGGIDGDAGPKTKEAIRKILEANRSRLPRGRISSSRMGIMAAQLVLDAAGYEPGPIDGYNGHNTSEAYNAWAYKQEHGRDEDIRGDDDSDSDSGVIGGSYSGNKSWPTQSGAMAYYGNVGENQSKIALPYKMKIAWNTRQTVSKFTCHKKVVEPLEYIFEQTLNHYGLGAIQDLRLDYFGGCLNVRKMRGGSAWSMHSWGMAVDLDPIRNQLRWGRDRASFAKADYEPFWKIVESTGAVSLGRRKNYDWMHWQFARV